MVDQKVPSSLSVNMVSYHEICVFSVYFFINLENFME